MEPVDPLHVRAVVVTSKPSCVYVASIGASLEKLYEPWMHCRPVGQLAR